MPSDIESEIEAIVASIKSSKKYRDTYEDTIRELVRIESRHRRTTKGVEKAVRKRLHKIVAAYIGDPDYDKAIIALTNAFQSGDQEAVREACARIMESHVSTRERLSILDQFYDGIFDLTGKPNAILDIACGLNPLTFPWMGIPATTKYYAYDIHERRIDFINAFFSLQGLPRLAKVQDVAFHFPEETADVALFLKELARFEQNYGGLGLALLDALRVRYLVVSFPAASFHGGRSLVDHYRRFFHEFTAQRKWHVEEIAFESELVFCVDKGNIR
jgi:16S rRNA (guanine(1405)-N(7))-methyltransferase